VSFGVGCHLDKILALISSFTWYGRFFGSNPKAVFPTWPIKLVMYCVRININITPHISFTYIHVCFPPSSCPKRHLPIVIHPKIVSKRRERVHTSLIISRWQ
jgi:hypothetical protein